MKNKKSKLQLSALYFAGASFIASIISVIVLVLKIDFLGWQHPISASLLASSFFFGFVCFVLIIIGTTNIPSFKVGDNANK